MIYIYIYTYLGWRDERDTRREIIDTDTRASSDIGRSQREREGMDGNERGVRGRARGREREGEREREIRKKKKRKRKFTLTCQVRSIIHMNEWFCD